MAETAPDSPSIELARPRNRGAQSHGTPLTSHFSPAPPLPLDLSLIPWNR